MRGLSAVTASLIVFFALFPSTNALSLKLKGRNTHPLFQRGAAGRLRSRQTQIVGKVGSASIGNAGDITYTSNITVGGVEHEVIVDTGR
jgi:hypothetical protein